MALQVITNPQSGGVSVQPAPINVPKIGGVAPAAPSAPLKVVSSPTGTTNYNPQGTASPMGATVNPQAGAANPQTGAVNPQASQTFKLGDGSVYDSSGRQISGPSAGSGAATGTSYSGNATQGTADVGLNTPTPDTTQKSTSLTNDTGYSDILKMLNDNLNNMDKLFSNMSAYATVPQAEQDQQSKVASDQAAMTGLGYQAEGLYNPGNQTIALPFLTGQAQNKLVGAGIQSQLDQSVLNYMQGNRQFAFNSASTIFDASRNSLQTMLDVYSKAAPQSLGTNYNPTTGQLTAIMRNPLTGATYTGDLGNIGAQKQFTSTNITTDPMTGALTFVGTTSDGKIIQEPIGGGAGFNSGSITNPLGGSTGSGNYTQTGNPQVSNAGGLLSNWTSGGTTMPGSGYQGAVYSTFQQMTGQKIDANTPTSTLIANIPALAAGIAKAENISPSLLAATNNPGAILYANQPGATPYTAQNGYTYAKFPTLADGQHAMNDLIAKKLGASPMTPPPSASLQQIVQSLPPALQEAVRFLGDGTPYFNANQLTSGQIPMAQAQATRTGIPYVNGDDANKLQNVTVTQDALQSLSQLVNRQGFLGSGQADGPLSGISNIISGRLNAAFGGTLMTNYNTYRTTAISALESLAGGSGSGLRINNTEIAQAIDNLPTYKDSLSQSNAKLTALNAKLNAWVTQIMPNWSPAPQATSQNYTNILDNLMKQGQ